MTPLQKILAAYRATSQSEREKGTYFEELIRTYFRFEASYADLYSDVWLYADWAKEIGTPEFGISGKDTGIDLVAKTRGTEEFHAIQCKCFAPDYRVRKADIDSFFTASGQKPFTQRIIVTTTNDWSENAEKSLSNQQPPVYKIDLLDLENSQIDWSKYQPSTAPVLRKKKDLRTHQTSAKGKVTTGLESADRGKLIMACGTGKTFTSLKIAEDVAGKDKRVLFLVPSLNLLSQTLTEWTQESAIPLHSFAVCSDVEVGKKRNKEEDIVETFAHELRYPATTDAKRLAVEMAKRHDAQHMSVVFSTYHSLDVISRAQHLHGLPPFDLVICDEAHRTTGASFEGDSESNFVKIHDNEFIRAAKRLYMTATPRIYGDMAKATAAQDNTVLYDMNDEAQFGKQLHVITFSEAVQLKLLTDYKVIVLTIDEAHVSARIQDLLKDDSNQLNVDDAARIIGCWKALGKQGLTDDLSADPEPMRRAVAFCQVIERSTGRTRKVSSKQIAEMFGKVVAAYQTQENSENTLVCQADHVDGGMNASQKEEKLNWLKAESPENTCRILSNVRCLSEGVDVPALDAVLFLTPRNSQVDVVQSVGRVMRNAPGKKRGYVILPVVIPVGMEPHEALNDNKVYKVVWQVLQALRSHDDTFDAMINKIDLTGHDTRKMEVIAITDKAQKKSTSSKDSSGKSSGKNQNTIGTPETRHPAVVQPELQFQVGELERALYAKVVKKCGNPNHWEEWAADIAKIAKTHISRITQIVQGSVGVSPASSSDAENAGGTPTLPSKEVLAFQSFANELRDDLNDSITDAEVIEMLAQHLITKPVFDALFEDYSFASHNPVSQAMQHTLEVLQEHRLDKEADTLEKFYASVKLRAASIDDVAAKQKIVVELYDKFFRNAFPRMTERLGIVYTPVEVVDFIIHSINDLLQSEFGQTLGSKGVHIIDPFTGTGTFITRLLQSGLISKEQLPHKYKHEIHANEIVLLAYYIAAINIEAVYHSLMKGHDSEQHGLGLRQPAAALEPAACCGLPMESQGESDTQGLSFNSSDTTQASRLAAPKRQQAAALHGYEPFQGICLTDTFQLYEKGDLISNLLTNNSDRRKRQKALDIRVIMGNPPYSAGQDSANDNNQNVGYPELDEKIRNTYAARSTATNKNALYDSYIRAVRWASDRVGKSGVVGFVTNGGFLEANTADGLRLCLADEFSSIYVFHLRGNARTSGEQRRKEKDNVFGQGSRAPIAISLLVKNPDAKKHGQIHFHDIGDYLSTEDKLGKIHAFASIDGITAASGWQPITPDAHGDWLKQRDDSFSNFIVLGDKKGNAPKLFENYSRGIETSRDAWCFNFSKQAVLANTERMIAFYNDELNRFKDAKPPNAKDFVNNDAFKISWSSSLITSLEGQRTINHHPTKIGSGFYRPFTKSWLYYESTLIHRMGQLPQIFPTPESENRVIMIKQRCDAGGGNFALIFDKVVELQTDGGSQCFPLFVYDKAADVSSVDDELFSTAQSDKTSTTRRDAITDAGLSHFQRAYPAKGEGESLSKEDLFYYIYGLLHSPDYRSRYADNLGKELPRIPAVKTFADFRAFSQAGRELAHWHLNYETVAMHEEVIVEEAPPVASLYERRSQGNAATPLPLPITTSKINTHPSSSNLSSFASTVIDRRYRVTKMKFGKTKDATGKSVNDKSTVIYNDFITLKNIPLAAYEYIVNGKPALEWVMERQSVTTDKDSGITNDANLWATETMGNPKYPLELFQRVVTVGLETMKVVNGLPKLEISVESAS
jgi:predicted helicase